MRAVALRCKMIVYALIFQIHNFICWIRQLVFNFLDDEGSWVDM